MGNCHSAIAVHCERTERAVVELTAVVYESDGPAEVSASATGRPKNIGDYEKLAIKVPEMLTKKGAKSFL